MNMRNGVRNLSMALALCAAALPLRADTVFKADGSEAKGVLVSSISESEVKLSGGGDPVELAQVKVIEFDAPDVPAKPMGVILKDGTILNGILKSVEKDKITFRATTFGLMEIPLDFLAGVYYDRQALDKLDLNAVKPPCAIYKDGTSVSGKLMWADEKSAGIMTGEGLKRLDSGTLACALYMPFDQRRKLVLRNGDVVNVRPLFQGEGMTIKFGTGAVRALKVKALRKLNLKS